MAYIHILYLGVYLLDALQSGNKKKSIKLNTYKWVKIENGLKIEIGLKLYKIFILTFSFDKYGKIMYLHISVTILSIHYMS